GKSQHCREFKEMNFHFAHPSSSPIWPGSQSVSLSALCRAARSNCFAFRAFFNRRARRRVENSEDQFRRSVLKGKSVLSFGGAVEFSFYLRMSAINAAVTVLKGNPSPDPFKIKDKTEVLFLLSHFVGDVHQPLHVGAIYLD